MRPDRAAPPHPPHPPLLLLAGMETACPVHTKSIYFWPIINKISHMDKSKSLCQQHNLDPLIAVSNDDFTPLASLKLLTDKPQTNL